MSKKTQLTRRTSIGGQAVLEGVMMRGATSMVTSVRDADGVIRVEAKRTAPLSKKNKFLGFPIVRGVVSFFDSLVSGMRIMTRSAEVFGESEPSKFEKWMSEKLKINVMNVVIGISVILGLALAIGLFIVLPTFITGLFLKMTEHPFWYTLVEGLLKIIIFVSYIALTSLLKDIRRTYMYHGAEHKTISCYERGMDLTVENVRTCPRVHDRCGTTFMFLVIMVSIIVFCLFNAVFPNLFVNDGFLGKLLRVAIKLCLLPVVAGISYEILKALSKTDSPLVYPLKLPGLLLQRITTREPDDSMIEVAITSFNKVLEMDADPKVPECSFKVAEKISAVTERTVKLFDSHVPKIDKSDAEWLVAIAAGVKRSEVTGEKILNPSCVEKIEKWAKERLKGKPLAYIVGNADFYGFNIDVDERVLIPRPETEELVEAAIACVGPDSKVLDLCTGSGAIAIAVAKKTGASVTASDICEDALVLARKNAEKNEAEIEFICSDMFESLGGKYDVIISNPPYIPDGDIDGLAVEVKDYEPRRALSGGADGLDFYRIIAAEAPSHLNENGVLFMECGFDQGDKIKEIFSDYASVEIKKDLGGNDRIVKAVYR